MATVIAGIEVTWVENGQEDENWSSDEEEKHVEEGDEEFTSTGDASGIESNMRVEQLFSVHECKEQQKEQQRMLVERFCAHESVACGAFTENMENLGLGSMKKTALSKEDSLWAMLDCCDPRDVKANKRVTKTHHLALGQSGKDGETAATSPSEDWDTSMEREEDSPICKTAQLISASFEDATDRGKVCQTFSMLGEEEEAENDVREHTESPMYSSFAPSYKGTARDDQESMPEHSTSPPSWKVSSYEGGYYSDHDNASILSQSDIKKYAKPSKREAKATAIIEVVYDPEELDEGRSCMLWPRSRSRLSRRS